MTQREDAAGSCAVAARWCALAERRLEHLTEMFETGRWRRYHSERDFLENIREAKRAVEIWRQLSEADPGATRGIVVDLPVLPRPSPIAPAAPEPDAFQRRFLQAAIEQGIGARPRAGVVTTLPTKATQARPATASSASMQQSQAAATPTPMNDVADFEQDLEAIQQRYPLLRNAL